MLDCLCFGEALIDFFPPRPGLPLSHSPAFLRHLGGAPANVAVGMARRGLSVGISTLVGADAFGDYVLSELTKEGIDVATIGRHPTAKTGVAFVAVAHDGARSFLFFRHPSADMDVPVEHVDRARIAAARLLHLGSSTLSKPTSRAATLRAVELAVELGKPISIDPNLRPHLWSDPDEARALLRPILARAAVVKIADDELEPLLGVPRDRVEEGAEALRALGCGVALVTLGERGAYYDAPAGRGHVPAFPVAVVDTTGAGDAFVAGFWSELAAELRDGRRPAELAEARIAAAVRTGCEVAAQAVTALGATAGVVRTTTVAHLHVPDPRPWTALDDDIEVLETRIFRLVRRRLRSPRTNEVRDFSVLKTPDWCNVVALTDDGHVVMVRQVRHGTNEVTLELPGGMIDPEDPDPLTGALRELREETGYAGSEAQLIGRIAPNPAMQNNQCHTALVRHAVRVGELEQDGGEDIDVVLVPYREIPERIARGEITHALVVVAFVWALGLLPPS